MLHKTVIRIVPGAKRAVLFLHGIVGTPNHFSDFLPLVPEGVSYCALLLDGHGEGVKEFSKTSMKKWLSQVEEAAEMLLNDHESLYVAAHSMGTLFAIHLALKHSAVKKLFLLAVPLKIFVRPAMMRDAFLVAFDRVKPGDAKALAAKKACGVTPDKRFWRYLGWIPRYLELFSLIRHTKKLLPNLKIPAQAYQSKQDEMVSMASCRLLENCGCVNLHILQNSSHHYYEAEDYRSVLASFQNFLN
jgi:carboxylesterase